MLRKVRCFNGWVAPGNQLFEFAARSTTLPLDTHPRLRRKFRRNGGRIIQNVIASQCDHWRGNLLPKSRITVRGDSHVAAFGGSSE